MADIFLSYQQRDRELALRIAAALKAEGFSVWWDDDVTPRESWDRTLEREIAAADNVLVLWTPNSVESDWVRIEANYARNCAPTKLVQARFVHAEIPIAFSLIQYADLDWDRPERDAAWPKLMQWLGKPAEAVSQPIPAQPEGFRRRFPDRRFDRSRFPSEDIKAKLGEFAGYRPQANATRGAHELIIDHPLGFVVDCVLSTEFIEVWLWEMMQGEGVPLRRHFGRGEALDTKGRLYLYDFKPVGAYSSSLGCGSDAAAFEFCDTYFSMEYWGVLRVTLHQHERFATRAVFEHLIYQGRRGRLEGFFGSSQISHDQMLDHSTRGKASRLRNYCSDLAEFGYPISHPYTKRLAWFDWTCPTGTAHYYQDDRGSRARPFVGETIEPNSHIGFVDLGEAGKSPETYRKSHYLMPVQSGNWQVERVEKAEGDTVNEYDRILLLRDASGKSEVVEVTSPVDGGIVRWRTEPEPGAPVIPYEVVATVEHAGGVDDLSSKVAGTLRIIHRNSGDGVMRGDPIFDVEW